MFVLVRSRRAGSRAPGTYVWCVRASSWWRRRRLDAAVAEMRRRGSAFRRLHRRLRSLLGLDACVRSLMTSLFRFAARVRMTVRFASRVVHTCVAHGLGRRFWLRLGFGIARTLEALIERGVAGRLRRTRGRHTSLALVAAHFAGCLVIASRFLAALVCVPARARCLTHRFFSGACCLAALTERDFTSL